MFKVGEKMADIELEEGEACFFQDYDDENLDPDKDFAYIEEKLQNVLGHLQKDFMGGLSKDDLGAKYGGYGSFLPVHWHSPPKLSNPRTQGHINKKNPENLPPELFYSQNDTATLPGNHSLPVKPGPDSSVNHVQPVTESGTSSINNQIKHQGIAECPSSNQQKSQMPSLSEQKALKFRVKIPPAKNGLSRDISAIYSGLGLDISPSSSHDGGSLDDDDDTPGKPEMNTESPSYIIKTMTTFPLLNDELLSPLHDKLLCLTGMENNLETAVPEAFIFNSIPGNNGTKFKVKNHSKNRRSKESKEMKSKRDRSVKPMELVKENHGYLKNTAAMSASDRERNGVIRVEVDVPKGISSGVDACSEETGLAPFTGKSVDCKPSMPDDDGEVRCSEERHVKTEDIGHSIQQFPVTDKMKLSPHDVQKGKKFNVRDHGANKFSKPQSAAKDKVNEGAHNPVCPKQDVVCRKENGTGFKIKKEKELDYFSMKNAGDKHDDFDEDVKCHIVETVEPSSKHSKAIPHSQVGTGQPVGKEVLSSVVKKKSRESRSDSICSEEKPKGRLVVDSSVPGNETVSKRNILIKNRRGNTDIKGESKTDNDAVSNMHLSKKLKDANVAGVFNNQKGKFCSKSNGTVSNIQSNVGGNLPSDSHFLEKVPHVDIPPAEGISTEGVPTDTWVQCDKCEQWRLLPPGMTPDSLPKEWQCSMLTWLPGMNKCSVKEEETNAAMRALYPPSVPIPQLQNNQEVYSNDNVISDGVQQNFGLSSQTPDFGAIECGGKRRHLIKMKTNATSQMGVQGPIAVKRYPQHLNEVGNSRNRKSVSQEATAVRKSGDGKPLKMGRKRLADPEISGAPKRLKKSHHGFMKNSDLVGSSTADAKGKYQANDSGALRITEDSMKRSLNSSLEVKGRRPTVSMDSEINDISGKKRKLKGQQENIDQRPFKKRASEKNSGTEPWDAMKERKSKVSNFQGRESSTDKGSGRTQSDGAHNVGISGDKIRLKRGRTDKMPLAGHHADRTSKKPVNTRQSSELIPDLGRFDNANASSLSKVSHKIKANTHEVKCSPVGSTSSSPFRIAKSDLDKGTNNIPIPCNEPDGPFSSSQMKFKKDVALNPHSEEIRDRKSNQCRISGAVSNVHVGDNSSRGTSAGRYSTAQGINSKMNVGDACLKVDGIFREGGSSTSQQSLFPRDHIAKSSNELQFEETNSERGKSVDPHIGSAHVVPESDKGRGSNLMSFGNFDMKLSKGVAENHVSLRLPHPSGHVSDKIESSSSVMKDNFHLAAKATLKEATSLKHSASRMKTSGSRHESTEMFFQAALKFLHGASMLKPGNTETSRSGEISSMDVYSTTATLCEYCALEFEKDNDLASAALAYKCMEVACMKVVFCNDIAASSDRMELQMAIRTAPQVESPSSSASDIDNLNNQAAADILRDGYSAVDHRTHVISATNRPNFVQMLNFTEDTCRAMDASWRSLSAFASANPILTQAGNEDAVSIIKSVLDFSFHDVNGLLHLVHLAMKALNSR